jgi:hypothetical protein
MNVNVISVYLKQIGVNMAVAVKRDPKKWAAAKARAKAKMGGKHSARAMQLAVKYYKDAGGGYSGKKKASNKLTKWSKQKWKTKSGKPSSKTGERYLPKKAIASLSSKEYAATTEAKRKGTTAGKQYVKQPKKIAKKTKRYRV